MHPPHPPGARRRHFLQDSAAALGLLAAWPGAIALAQASDAKVADGRSGAAQAGPALPAWAPTEPGSLRVLNTRNSFMSQNSGLPGWEHAFGRLVDDYSGGVFNPYWGPLGAMVFHGGGHSATFDNSVVLLDLNDLTFKRVSQATPAQGGKYWADARKVPGGGDPAFDTTHCEYGDGQPGSGHTYDTLAILPPQAGGAACGSLVRVASFAVHVTESCNTGWTHRFDFTSTALRDGHWTRASGNGFGNYIAPGACSAYDSLRNRIWWLASLTSAPGHIRYLDVASGLHVQVPLAPGAMLAPYAAPDSPTLRYDPLHDLLLMTGTVGSQAALAYLHCDQPQAGWTTPVLSQPIPTLPNASLGFDRVPAQDSYIVLSSADRQAVYALRLPERLEQPWAVARQPLARLEFPSARVVGKRWSYCEAAGCFVWMASSTSPVVAYRPLR